MTFEVWVKRDGTTERQNESQKAKMTQIDRKNERPTDRMKAQQTE